MGGCKGQWVGARVNGWVQGSMPYSLRKQPRKQTEMGAADQ